MSNARKQVKWRWSAFIMVLVALLAAGSLYFYPMNGTRYVLLASMVGALGCALVQSIFKPPAESAAKKADA